MKMTSNFFVTLFSCVLTCGMSSCATVPTLKSSTVSQGRTALELIYEMVLDNLAAIRQEPESLPWHLKVTQGGVGITDTAAPNLSFTWPPTARTAGVNGSRQWAVSWTVVPVLDGKVLRDLQRRYRHEVGNEFSKYYGEGPTEPNKKLLSTQYDGRSLWVRPDQMAHFMILVTDILKLAPIEAVDKPLMLPGPQAPR